MHSIANKQNEARQLRYLAAQRQVYASAKTLMGWQLALSGPLAVAAALVGIFLPEYRSFAVLAGLSVLVIDAVWLTPRQKKLRESGAKIQERFDCDVLAMEWNSVKCGSAEPPEYVLEQSANYAKWAHRMSPLTDWYPGLVDKVKLPLARLICQRSNCWWDASQRRLYSRVMASALLVACLAVFMFALAAKLSVQDLILVVLTPLAPTLRLSHQQWKEHHEAAERLDRLRERADGVWLNALKDPHADAVVRDARLLQDEIYEGRRRNPPVFDLIFRRLRSSHEAQMVHAATELVGQAEKSLG
jgi:SMODS-associating 4TM effector domain